MSPARSTPSACLRSQWKTWTPAVASGPNSSSWMCGLATSRKTRVDEPRFSKGETARWASSISRRRAASRSNMAPQAMRPAVRQGAGSWGGAPRRLGWNSGGGGKLHRRQHPFPVRDGDGLDIFALHLFGQHLDHLTTFDENLDHAEHAAALA